MRLTSFIITLLVLAGTVSTGYAAPTVARRTFPQPPLFGPQLIVDSGQTYNKIITTHPKKVAGQIVNAPLNFNAGAKNDLAAISAGKKCWVLFDFDPSTKTFLEQSCSDVGADLNSNLRDMTAGDFDGDGDLDVSFTRGTVSATTVRVLYNNGSGSFGGGVALRSNALNIPNKITTGFFNNDSSLDIAVSDQTVDPFAVVYYDWGIGIYVFDTSQTNNFHPGRGFGGFGAMTMRPFAFKTFDFDGDNFSDLIFANDAAEKIGTFDFRVYSLGFIRNTFVSDLAFDLVNQDVNGSTPFPDSYGVVAGKFDGGAELDLLALHESGPSAAYFNEGKSGDSFNFVQGAEFSGTSLMDPKSIESEDLNLDGWPDFVVASETNSTVSVFLNKRTDPATFHAPIVLVMSKPKSVSLVDLDDDGDQDLLTVNANPSSNDEISVRLNTLR